MNNLHIIQYNNDIHLDQFYQLNLEYYEWADTEFKTLYNNPINPAGTIKEYLDNVFPGYTRIKPPHGLILVLEGEKGLEGMGTLQRLKDEVGEITRVYIRPNARGGYGKKLISSLVKGGLEFGFSKLELNTAKFMKTAQHIYKTLGFKETGYHFGNTMNPDKVTAIHMEMVLRT